MDLKENRLSIIIEDIISEGQIDIKSLSKKLKVSTMTIYRDIEEFTKRGVIKKEKGILSSSQIFTLEYFHDVRAKLNIQSKIKVAEEAVKIIQPNILTIFFDKLFIGQIKASSRDAVFN